MTAIALPSGWDEIEEPHPDDGIVAYAEARYRHTEGAELVVWAGVTEDARDYNVTDADEYSFELYAAEGDYIEGAAFETMADTVAAATEAMTQVA